MSSTSLPVTIGTHHYDMELRGFQRDAIASARQMQDSSREPSDRSLDNPGLWKRDRSDFILGAGQQFLDQEDESDSRRFRTSKGVDVWDRRQLTLLHDTSAVTQSMTAGGGAAVVTGTSLYMFNGGGMKFDGTTWAACTGITGTVKAACVIGGYVYIATGNGLKRAADGGTAFSAFGGATPDTIGTGGGRLVGGDGAVLYEVLNDGMATIIYTHFEGSNFQWKRIISAPNGIYCFGDDAGRSVVYLLTVVDATGELSAPYPTLQMQDGEFIRDCMFFGGVIALATNLGFRLASINGSGFLTAGPLVEIGDIKCLGTDGRDIWFGWSNFDASSTGLGRMRPERFTGVLTPAYASDLMRTGQGTVVACASFQGKRYFLVEASSVVYLMAQSANRVASGTYYSGGITYGTPEPMGAQSIEGQWDTLPTGSSVAMALLDSIGGSALTGGFTATSGTDQRGEFTNIPSFQEAEVRITLTRGTTTTTSPVVRRWTLRALVLAYKTFQMVAPVIIAPKVQHALGGRNSTVTYDPLDEFEYLQGLADARTVVDFRMGSRTEKVLIDSVGIGPDVQDAGPIAWLDDDSWISGVWAVRMLTIGS